MGKFPVVSGQDLFKIFHRLGYYVDHQTGSHAILRNKDRPHRRLTVPIHKEIARGTLHSIIRQAGITPEEFLKLR